jgi:hypothetical protein
MHGLFKKIQYNDSYSNATIISANCNTYKEVKFILGQAMKVQRGSTNIALLFL